MQRMVDIFQRNRLEHKETFRKQAMAMDGLLSEHEHKMQQQEIDHFVREIKQIHLWDVMGNKILVVQRHKLSLRKQQDSLQKRRRRSSAADVGGQSEGGEEEEGTGEGGEGTESVSSEESGNEGQGTNAFSAGISKLMLTRSFSTSAKFINNAASLESHPHDQGHDPHVIQRSASDAQGSCELIKAQMAVLQRTVQRLDASLSEHKRLHASVNAQILSKLDLLIGQQPHTAPQASSEGRDPVPAVCPLQPPSPHTLSVFEDICASGRWAPAFIQEETEEVMVEADGLFKANPVSEEDSERDRKVGEEGGSAAQLRTRSPKFGPMASQEEQVQLDADVLANAQAKHAQADAALHPPAPKLSASFVHVLPTDMLALK